MYITQSIHTTIALKAIKEYLETGTTKQIENSEVPKKLSIKAACFVTLKSNTNKLRGCIGTLKPAYKNLFLEIIKNSVASATRDYRFSPLQKSDLNKIKLSVEVLYPPEKIKDISYLNPKIYGAIVSDRLGNKGVLLPDIDGIDSVEEQINIIKRKAGIIQTSNEGLVFYRFKTDKFY